jgi:hypothetical protein
MDHRWLALLGVLLFPLLAAVRQAFPSIPDRFVPLLSLCGGLAAGVGHALATGSGWEDALWSAAIGVAGGGSSVAFHEAMKSRPSPSAPSSDDAASGPPTPKSPKSAPELSRVAWASCLLVVWAFAGTCLACTVADRKTAKSIADGAVVPCEAGLTILADAPELAGVCVGVDELIDAALAWADDHQAAPGAMKLSAHAKPTKADIHRIVMKRRAAAAAQLDGGAK